MWQVIAVSLEPSFNTSVLVFAAVPAVMEETPGVSAKGRWTSSNAVAKTTGAAGSKPPIPCLETHAEGNTNSSKFRSTVTEPL